ncbi:MAG: HAMP domain-containing protein, partial [Dokdonella sp.]
MRRHYPLHLHISTLLLALILVVCATIAAIGYRLSSELLSTSAADLTVRASREAQAEVRRLIEPAEMATRLLSLQPVTQARSLAERLQSLDFLRQALDSSPALSSLYVGYDNGDFFLVGRIGHGSTAERARAPAGTVYVVQSVERGAGAARGHFLYFDAQLQKLRADERPEYAAAYDPRQRPWYVEATSAPTLIQTPPYPFFASGKVGTTLAKRTANARGVVGADILLHTLDQLLASQKATPASQLVLATADGEVLAHTTQASALTAPLDRKPGTALARIDQLGVPALASLLPEVITRGDTDGDALRVTSGGGYWQVTIAPLRLERMPALYLVSVIPEDELMAAALQLVKHSASATLLVLLCTVPLTWLLARSISRSLADLASEANAIRHFEFSRPIGVQSTIREVNQLALTMDEMKRTIRRFLELSHAVAAEQNFARLLPRLLADTLAASAADAGVLYLSENGDLSPASALQGDGSPMSGPPSLRTASTGPLLASALAAGRARSGRLQAEDFQALGLPVEDDRHAIAVPLLNRSNDLVGAMILLCPST